MLNDPPQGFQLPPGVPGPGDSVVHEQHPSVEDIERSVNPDSEVPIMEQPLADFTVELPAGWLSPQGELISTAQVRELSGFDEERLAKLDPNKNTPVFVTELLSLGIERIGDIDRGDKGFPKDLIRELLIGDRDALTIGIRRATYGNDVEMVLQCSSVVDGGCGERSDVLIDLVEDVPTELAEDPYKREFEVELKHGMATVKLMSGADQETMAQRTSAKTTAPETITLMLAKSVTSINNVPTGGRRETILGLSGGDRKILNDFIAEHQPGPRTREIKVPCATCGKEYPVLLGLGDLFRFV